MSSNWFFNRLDALRKKPSHVKSLIAFGVSGGITLVIASFWVVSYSSYLSGVQSDSAYSLLSPFKKFGEFVGSRYANMASTKVFEPEKNSIQSISETVAKLPADKKSQLNTQPNTEIDTQISQQNPTDEASTSTKKLIQ